MCDFCDSPSCIGEENTLRHFDSWSDLVAHASEEIILEWVNSLEKAKTQVENQKLYGKRYREKRKQFARLALSLLDEDERREIRRQVDEKII